MTANQIDKREIRISVEDNTLFSITIFIRDNLPVSAPIFICVPAMGVSAKYYNQLAAHFSREGWALITTDMRPESLGVGRIRNLGYREILEVYCPALVEAVKLMFPESPSYLLGHSLGGYLSSLFLSANPHSASGLILIAAHSTYYKGWDFPRNYYVLLGTQLAWLIAGIIGYYPGKRIGFGGDEAYGLICDWARQARTGKCRLRNSSVDYDDKLSELRKPILAFSFERDYLAPKRAVENLNSKMKRSQLTHIHMDHEDMDHFSWVKNPEVVILKIKEWLKQIELILSENSYNFESMKQQKQKGEK